jgi:hypothetical protein
VQTTIKVAAIRWEQKNIFFFYESILKSMLKHMSNGPVSGQNRPSRGLNRSIQPLNVSTLSTPGSGAGPQQHHHQQNNSIHSTHNNNINHHHHQHTKMMNGGPRLMSSYATPLPSLSSNSHNNNYNNNNNMNHNSNNNSNNNNNNNNNHNTMNKDRIGAREALTSLGLLCLGEI